MSSQILNSANDTHLYWFWILQKIMHIYFIGDISKSISLTNLSSFISYNSIVLVIEKLKEFLFESKIEKRKR